MTHEKCDPACRGWFLANDGNEVQRCDECNKFATDIEAFAFAVNEDAFVLRGQVNEARWREQLEIRVTGVLRERHGVDYAVYFQGHDGAGSLTLFVLPLEGDVHGIATVDKEGDVHFGGLTPR